MIVIGSIFKNKEEKKDDTMESPIERIKMIRGKDFTVIRSSDKISSVISGVASCVVLNFRYKNFLVFLEEDYKDMPDAGSGITPRYGYLALDSKAIKSLLNVLDREDFFTIQKIQLDIQSLGSSLLSIRRYWTFFGGETLRFTCCYGEEKEWNFSIESEGEYRVLQGLLRKFIRFYSL